MIRVSKTLLCCGKGGLFTSSSIPGCDLVFRLVLLAVFRYFLSSLLWTSFGPTSWLSASSVFSDVTAFNPNESSTLGLSDTLKGSSFTCRLGLIGVSVSPLASDSVTAPCGFIFVSGGLCSCTDIASSSVLSTSLLRSSPVSFDSAVNTTSMFGSG